jgi:hypothetical protein
MKLRYRGADVDNGTMGVDDVLEALQGFSGAFGKVAAELTPDVQYQLRLSAINKSSFELLMLGAAFVIAHKDQLKALETLADAAKRIFRIVVDVINLKKHTKGQPYNLSITGDHNTVLVINAEGQELAIQPPALDVYKEKLIDADLSKIAAPLRPKSIESAEIVEAEDGAEQTEAIITNDDKDYFRSDGNTTTSRETDLAGTLISLNKETNAGTFKFGNGKTCRYRYKGDDPEKFHRDFAYKGLVRVTCMAEFDENLTVTRIDIVSVQRLQGEIEFPQLNE